MSVARHKIFLAISAVGILLSCGTSPTKPAKTNLQSPPTAEKQPSQGDGVVVPPEVVRCKNVQIAHGVKTLTMSNTHGDYLLSCSIKAAGCTTPEPAKNYLLFNKNTRWKMPGAQPFITLAFVQNWTVTYNEAENIGLVTEDGAGPSELGMYKLDSWSSNIR
ncbi:MAG: hypothetical protein ACRD4P_00460 [Bryobacteraceae bacterium]